MYLAIGPINLYYSKLVTDSEQGTIATQYLIKFAILISIRLEWYIKFVTFYPSAKIINLLTSMLQMEICPPLF